jgi:molybdopterin/thiamine biosynthesis adenylyltransferase
MDFTNDQIERYSRHILLKDIGGIGQKKLLESRVLIIGAGGLGSPIATYLAAAGVGTIGIVDADVVDLSNLQRQILHHTADVGVKKVESAKATIESLNPDVKVELHPYRLDASNIREVIREYDFISRGHRQFSHEIPGE